ncbi:MAG TPA: zf-HC2 domain-containing protein, partial [Planctomycetaceae bacterium]|nr:zf-HC2 domain-containing protein [Planctomycetaceae bacterium]
MNSKIPDDLLSAFLDRELTAAEGAAVSKHLKDSPQARQELQDYQRLSELLHELPRRTVSAEFASSVMQRAERETLIPLDPVATVDRRSLRRKLSRRALALTAVGVVAASIILLMIVDLPRRQRDEALVAKAVEFNAAQGLDLRTASESAANLPAAAAESPAQSAAPVAVAQNTARAATILSVAPAFKKGAVESKQAKLSASPVWGRATEGNGAELVLPTDLKKAKVGDVIEAMEKVGDQVAVVRLKVVDQSDGLGQLRSLLVREPARIGQKQGTVLAKEKEAIREQAFAYQKNPTAGDQGQMAKNKAGDLICVFIEESREELADLLKDMQAERPFQQAELTNTISVEKLS